MQVAAADANLGFAFDGHARAVLEDQDRGLDHRGGFTGEQPAALGGPCSGPRCSVRGGSGIRAGWLRLRRNPTGCRRRCYREKRYGIEEGDSTASVGIVAVAAVVVEGAAQDLRVRVTARGECTSALGQILLESAVLDLRRGSVAAVDRAAAAEQGGVGEEYTLAHDRVRADQPNGAAVRDGQVGLEGAVDDLDRRVADEDGATTLLEGARASGQALAEGQVQHPAESASSGRLEDAAADHAVDDRCRRVLGDARQDHPFGQDQAVLLVDARLDQDAVSAARNLQGFPDRRPLRGHLQRRRERIRGEQCGQQQHTGDQSVSTRQKRSSLKSLTEGPTRAIRPVRNSCRTPMAICGPRKEAGNRKNRPFLLKSEFEVRSSPVLQERPESCILTACK